MSEHTLIIINASPAVLLERIFNEEQGRLPVVISGVPFLSYAEITTGDWPAGGDIVTSYCAENVTEFQAKFARNIEKSEMNTQYIHRFRYVHFVHVRELVIRDARYETSTFIDQNLSLYSDNAIEIPELDEPNLPTEWDDSDEVL